MRAARGPRRRRAERAAATTGRRRRRRQRRQRRRARRPRRGRARRRRRRRGARARRDDVAGAPREQGAGGGLGPPPPAHGRPGAGADQHIQPRRLFPQYRRGACGPVARVSLLLASVRVIAPNAAGRRAGSLPVVVAPTREAGADKARWREEEEEEALSAAVALQRLVDSPRAAPLRFVASTS